MPHILVIHHAPGDRVEMGVLADALDASGVTWDSIDSSAGDPVPETLGDKYDGLIVLGGVQNVPEQDKYPFLRQEIALLRRSVDENRPVLGGCLGAQLLAAALDAPVYEAPKLEVGWQPLQLTSEASHDALLGGTPDPFPAFHWHAYRFDLPAGAVLLASSALTPNQAFRYGERAWGLQFHPEVKLAEIRRWMDEAPEEMGEAGTSRTEIEAGCEKWLAGQREFGRRVAERWARHLSAPSREHLT